MDNKCPKKTIKKYQKSDVIFKSDSIGDKMYIVSSGKIKLILEDEKGEAEVGIVEKPGEFFGEMALIDDSPRTATAIVEEDNTELEILNRDDFLQTIRLHPEFALNIMHELSRRIRLGNALYLEVVEGAMSPFCRHNCLMKTMNAFARRAMSQFSQERDEGATGIGNTGIGNWKCATCDYIYVPEFGDPQSGIPPGTPFEELPDTWTCPDCGEPKSVFRKIEC